MGDVRKSKRTRIPRNLKDFEMEVIGYKRKASDSSDDFGDETEPHEKCKEKKDHLSLNVDMNTSNADDIKHEDSVGVKDDTSEEKRVTKKVSEERRVECIICKKTFGQRSSLTQHMLIHSGERPYKCDICSKKFVQKSACETHKRRVHTSEKIHKCLDCDYAAKVFCDLQNHRMRKHSTDKPFNCDMCDVKFSTTKSRSNHIAQVHHRGPHFSCSECPYKTHTKNLLQMHVKARHSKTEGFRCEICNSVLKTQYSHLVHMRSHTGVKPYQCDQCGKEFVSSSRVAAHKKTHAEPECLCTICGKKFINKHKLKIHVDGVHDSSVIFPCPWCKYRTAVKHNLKKHCKNVHDLDYPPRCGRRNIPIKEREEVLKNGPQTIVLPPPVYPDAIDVGLKGIKETTNTLLVKQLPLYISNVQNGNDTCNSKSAGRRKVYCVDILKKTKPVSQGSKNNTQQNDLIAKPKPKSPIVTPSETLENPNNICKHQDENITQKWTRCDKIVVPTLQTLLTQPKDIVIQNERCTQHTVQVALKNSSSLSVSTNRSVSGKSSDANSPRCNTDLNDNGAPTDREPDSIDDFRQLEIVEQCEETNVAVANLETIATQPAPTQSVQVFNHGDHSYFVIGNDEDIDGANIQEVIIDNSEHRESHR